MPSQINHRGPSIIKFQNINEPTKIVAINASLLSDYRKYALISGSIFANHSLPLKRTNKELRQVLLAIIRELPNH